MSKFLKLLISTSMSGSSGDLMPQKSESDDAHTSGIRRRQNVAKPSSSDGGNENSGTTVAVTTEVSPAKKTRNFTSGNDSSDNECHPDPDPELPQLPYNASVPVDLEGGVSTILVDGDEIYISSFGTDEVIVLQLAGSET